MITNNLLIKLKERNNENIEKTKAALLSMQGKIEVLIEVQVETDILNKEVSYDVLLITKFATLEDMNAYITHPDHIDAYQSIQHLIETVASVCYES
ncbi:Dabb family protein [Lacrimispora sp. AGF001]|uniref:Dabb family protein n=1 Tax=Lacrimispora sp. AGF001 TaxID=3401631 RepID=UPI003B42931F|nr:Dabb family protein [Paenibacillaceae bacterium]